MMRLRPTFGWMETTSEVDYEADGGIVTAGQPSAP
jgi:hypothetical protein